MANIVITGSTRGLGFAMAKCFLEKGNKVIVSGKSSQNLELAMTKFHDHLDMVHGQVCNVAKRDDLQNLWSFALERLGTVDIWINNSGINQVNRPLWEMSEADTASVVNTNLYGIIYGSQIAVSGMLEQGSGFVYNMEGFGSNNSFRKGLNLYGMTKRALTHFTQALSKELIDTNVKAGLLSPGMMVTDFVKGTVGEDQETRLDENTKKIFNILGDKPETVAKYLVNKILINDKNGAHIKWLTTSKAMARFTKAIFVKRELFDN